MIDFILSDPETYRLLTYGIEGENYTLPDGEHIQRIGGFSLGYNAGFKNDEIGYEQYYSDPETYKLLNEIKEKSESDILGIVYS